MFLAAEDTQELHIDEKRTDITSIGHLDLPNSTDASWNIAQVGISADKHLAAANR